MLALEEASKMYREMNGGEMWGKNVPLFFLHFSFRSF
jgi:hypothetical protein